MAGAKFEYDEQGSTFYYFVISFYALVLVPATYYLWPRRSKKGASGDVKKCQCEPCLDKDNKLQAQEPYRNLKKNVVRILLILGWIGFIVLAYKVAQIEVEHQEYDPFGILGLDAGATDREIKRAYRKLSLKHHPDRGGEPKRFVEIAKAYEALTNEDVKANWEKYGNPDGPGVMRFGIALPSWIIEKDNSVWVLAIYLLAFMVILPTVVGVWWYRSIRYSADQVLLDTTHLYYHFFHKTPNMILRRVIMILAASFEFEKSHNKEIIERPSDDFEIPQLMKDLPNLNEKNKERPLCCPYSIKARALLHAHLSRIQLSTNTLDIDKLYVLQKCPSLIQEMISVIAQLVIFANAGRTPRMPSMDTLEGVMRLSPMLVQALWDYNKSPLLQLPHISEEMLKHCVTKRRRITTCAELALMNDEDRKSMFRDLEAQEYRDLINVLCSMPKISMEVRVEVQDDEDKTTITAGSLVTVFVKLKRDPLMKHGDTKPSSSSSGGLSHASSRLGSHQQQSQMELQNDGDDGDDVEDDADDQAAVVNGSLITENSTDKQQGQQPKRRVWEKNKKKKGAKGGAPNKNKKKTGPKPVLTKKPAASAPVPAIAAEAAATNDSPKSERPSPKVEKSKSNKRAEKIKRNRSDDEDSDAESLSDAAESFSGSDSDIDDAIKEKNARDVAEDIAIAEEEDLPFDDDMMKKERMLETKSKITHLVHCPYFPMEKYEWWWVYLCDKRRHGDKRRQVLITSPAYVTSLIDEEEVELKFPAPPNPGNYAFQVCVRSDSYLDCDQTKEVKFQVHPAREVTSHPQWDFPSEEEDKDSGGDMSDGSEYTEDELEDDD